MAYSLNATKSTGSKITKFAPEKYDSATLTTTITGFAENVGVQELGVNERGMLCMTFYREENGEKLYLDLPIYNPSSEKQGNFQLAMLRDTLFVFFGQKEVILEESDDWTTVIKSLASNFTFPSVIVESSKLKVVLNKKGWQTVSSQFPIATSDLFAQILTVDEKWEKMVYTKEEADKINEFATPVVNSLSNLINGDTLPF